jgi:hypothetical protein
MFSTKYAVKTGNCLKNHAPQDNPLGMAILSNNFKVQKMLLNLLPYILSSELFYFHCGFKNLVGPYTAGFTAVFDLYITITSPNFTHFSNTIT